jgi:signal transduction histidine kinase
MRYMALHGSFEQDKRAEAAARLRRYRRRLRACEQRLRREQAARAAAENALVEKDRALAAVCHDLRTPLNAIVGWTQVARSAPDDREELGEALSRIETNARLQAMLIDDILELARSAHGALRIDRQVVDVKSVVAAALEVVEPMAAAGQVRLEYETTPDAAFVVGDAVRLQQVVWNLLTNAVKFTPAGGYARVELETEGEQVLLRVSDSGRGISPDFLPRVFERFQQDAPGGDGPMAGAGLGLAIVRRLVETHGGSVKAESPGVGRGATFTVTLPKAPPPKGSGA